MKMIDSGEYDPNENYQEDRYSYERGHYGGVDVDPNLVEYDEDDYNEDEEEGHNNDVYDYDFDTGEQDDLFDTYIEEEEDAEEEGLVLGSSQVLLSILETAFEQYHTERPASDEDTDSHSPTTTHSANIPSRTNHHHRDQHLEQTWKAIRTHWLWAYNDRLELRARGARQISESSGLAPLHWICKLSKNPPTDLLQEIVGAAPEVAAWEDAHGWLPLHHACRHGASTEVLKLLVGMLPSSVVALDAHHRTPLHLYATRGISDHYNARSLATNFGILCQAAACGDETNTNNDLVLSPAQIRDKAGMLPMHYACAYGTTPSVLRVLEEAFPESLDARDDQGRTPLHFCMVNAQRGTSPGVLGYLLGHYPPDHEGQDNTKEHHPETVSLAESTSSMGPNKVTHRPNHQNSIASVNVRDSEGNLPLHLLNLGLVGADFDLDPNKLDCVSECLKLYLEAEPHVSTDFLAALQTLPDPLRDVAVVSPHVRTILNAKIIQRFPTSILMLDGIMLVTMIVCFEVATSRFVDQVVAEDSLENAQLLSSPLVMLYVTAAYFFLRELIQVIASISLGAFGSWLYDTTNWLDVLVIALVTYYTTTMTLGEPLGGGTSMEDRDEIDLEGFRTGTALTKGALWTAVIFFLKSTQVDFAVFLNGVFYVVRRLVAFLLAILVILISFAQMFWLVYLEQPVCKFSCREGDQECEAEMEGCSYPHCEFGDSFLKVYTMMMGEIGTETRYDQNLVAQILYIFYGFFIVILLSNVLIAIVTDSYEVVQNDRAAIVFWSNRLDFVAEMDSIASVVRKQIFCTDGDGSNQKTSIVPNATQDDRSYESCASSNHHTYNAYGSEEWFRDKWNSIMSMFDHDIYGASVEDNRPIDFWYDILNKTLAIFVIPPWLILGFVTVGILWPPQVRELLFVQKDTAASRAEIERRKIEQLQEIQRDTKLLKEELKMEMQHDREEMFRMKAEVDAVQEEVLSDLQQVNALVTTLLTDLGGTPLEGSIHEQ